MEHIYLDLFQWVQAHGMLGVFVFMLTESGGVPFPTELGFITAQGLIEAGYSSYWDAFVWITVGHLLGAGSSYYAGRAGDNALAKRFSHSKRMMRARETMQHWYTRYGPAAIVFGRLVGQVRPWASFVAGLARVPQPQFWVWTVIGSVIYTWAAMWVTEWGWQLWVKYPNLRATMVVTVLVVFYGAVVYAAIANLVKRRRRRRKLAEEEI